MERDFYFLGAKLKAKIEQLSKEKVPQPENVEPLPQEDTCTNVSRIDSDSKNDLTFKFDQLCVQNQTLERETEILKKKYEQSRSEHIRNRSTIESLRSQLSDKCNEMDSLRAHNERLVQDAETFERYVDSLHSDQSCLKSILQNVQHAFGVTRDELSKTTALQTESLRSLNKLNTCLAREKNMVTQLQQEVVVLQDRTDDEFAQKTELSVRCANLQHTVAAMESKLTHLADTLESERHKHNLEKSVTTNISAVSVAANSWTDLVEKLVVDTNSLQEMANEKYNAIIASKDAEIKNLMDLLREREVKHTEELKSYIRGTVPGITSTNSDRKGMERVTCEAPVVPQPSSEYKAGPDADSLEASAPCPQTVDGSTVLEGVGKKRPVSDISNSKSDRIRAEGAVENKAGGAQNGVGYGQMNDRGSNGLRSVTTVSGDVAPPMGTSAIVTAQAAPKSVPISAINTQAGDTTDSSSNGSCSVCGELPYGLMKLCSTCRRQFHSACARQLQLASGSTGKFCCNECA